MIRSRRPPFTRAIAANHCIGIPRPLRAASPIISRRRVRLLRSIRIPDQQNDDATLATPLQADRRADPVLSSGSRRRSRRSSLLAVLIPHRIEPAKQSLPRWVRSSRSQKRRWCRERSKLDALMAMAMAIFTDYSFQINVCAGLRPKTRIEARSKLAPCLTDLIGFERTFDHLGNRTASGPQYLENGIEFQERREGLNGYSTLKSSSCGPSTQYQKPPSIESIFNL
ncbi:hypothetical protein SAMN05216228_10907 [Rhizobium tibeticum]|uniref:Uncharacterized protein n=1 Tax=Rhizobium tibeticum TaxID=501024 RepID=A0A1H8X0L3_9HYPH|nr:hypothetical protein RTCCBAU85039_6777 [Rhizobium tibeticum]SEP33495.1 hypothetical protein SAMN05216228_10907 [Rhizobium tibeticum]